MASEPPWSDNQHNVACTRAYAPTLFRVHLVGACSRGLQSAGVTKLADRRRRRRDAARWQGHRHQNHIRYLWRRPPGRHYGVSTDNNYLASVRGRLGFVGGPFMLYGTGGAAWTNISSNATWTPIPGALVPAPSASAVSFDGNKTGFVVGGGVEWIAELVAPGRVPVLRIRRL